MLLVIQPITVRDFNCHSSSPFWFCLDGLDSLDSLDAVFAD
jgi:hypothetical protein